ncbi:MAG: glycosyltransferase family 9 protein [Anaerolineae bacterium]|nr:glycosyltransferase family 9 protein [Anaerolineae bacterium]
MDKEALVLRNRHMANAFHALPIKHRVRRVMLGTIGHIPIYSPKPTQQPERILLIRPDHLGDMLLTTPAIHALRAARPDAEIHALVGPWSADAIAGYPEVNVVLTLAFPGFSRDPKDNWRSPYALALRAAGHLRRIGYSSAIIFRPDHWWGAMVARLAGIPERIGYDLPDTAPFLSDAAPFQHQHAVLQNLRLVERWTGTLDSQNPVFRFPVDSLDQGYINGYLEEWGIQPKSSVICIHPGSGTWVKRWQAEKWAKTADTLTEQLDAPVVFTGGGHEMPLVQQISDFMQHRACIMVGDTRVGQLAALFSRARVVLGPDSGPLHLAAAVGAPTVALFGPADPVEFRPWGPPDKHYVLTSDIGCRPCRVLDWGDDDPANHPCVQDITFARVLDAARRAAKSAS